MEKLTFSTPINASKERVWNTLWGDATYRQWTAIFHEGSYAESDWQEGSKILFLSPGGNGMSSRIARLVPNEFMSFEHRGVVKDGVEDFSEAQAKGWSGSLENYSLREQGGTTVLTAELDMDEEHKGYFLEVFPKAFEKLKQLAEAQKITPFLWFDNQAEEAIQLYTSIFPNSKIGKVVRNGEAVMTAGFSLGGQEFAALNGGPMFKINPSISFYTICETEAELDAAWQKLVEGGSVLMPLDKYPWSEKYGWLQDRFGLNWQLTLGKIADLGQKFTPALMFVGEQQGKAEAAINFYTSVFKNSGTKFISRYEAGGLDPEGTVQHAQFRLDGQTFTAMDSAMAHSFQFNEALSFVISCHTQAEIDYFWDALTADGGAESQCGWLKDKFGVSWQVAPPVLVEMLSDPDPAKAQRAMGAMMQMRKIDIEKLRQAALDDSKKVITVEATVEAPLEKVWQLWTQPEHIVHWNNASDDWHTPRAENDLRTGGSFNYRMEARDGSFAFDFEGVYHLVLENQRIGYTMADGRKTQISFSETGNGTQVIESFEAENTNSVELQRTGWQAILDNFKKYAEGKG